MSRDVRLVHWGVSMTKGGDGGHHGLPILEEVGMGSMAQHDALAVGMIQPRQRLPMWRQKGIGSGTASLLLVD